ncbi:hypothetical protein BBP40_002587 [Aspergillus hancockii]|nr:hypothetical protein BBP40_002587 [Aspergillus hancockii]
MSLKKEEHASDHSTLAEPTLLDKIDKLFACNVGQYIDLPQLVVVGDQSSGKSSVLEGLTRIPFPRDSGLCTRFATQIIFRRNKELSSRNVTASIIPAPDSNTERATQLKGWTAESNSSCEPDSFADIMQTVYEMMGVATTENSSQPTFSKDIFRVEICGPEEDHLSVIDVPGIFKNTTPGLTSKTDIQVVRDMVEGYMKNPRSIMLTVIPANVDIATQEIMEMARDYDPNGERTIGVLTKPDLVDKGAENNVLNLLAGKKMTLLHGWIVVRNLNQQELLDNDTDRDQAEEAWHRKAPWNKIAVRAEIARRLKDSRNALKELGDERETPEQQATFLTDIMTKFQDITSQALSTNYGANDIFDKHEELRLATIIVTRDAGFAEDLSQWGHEYKFKVHDDEGHKSSTANDIATPPPEPNDEKGVETRKMNTVAELDGIIDDQTFESLPIDEDILEWLKKLYQTSRGFEIGTFNVSLLATSMKKQSVKWSKFARGYISDIITVIHRFIVKGLEIASVDKRLFGNLLSMMMDDLLTKYQQALNQVDFLLHVERNGTPKTLNHCFNENHQKCHEKRFHTMLKENVYTDVYNNQVIRLQDIAVQNHMSNSEYTIQDIHDILQSYYNVARNRFVDNICIQAADYYLVNGPETPMKLFSPSFVNKLSKDKLAEIAGEDASVRRRRQNLKKEIRELEDGRKILL